MQHVKSIELKLLHQIETLKKEHEEKIDKKVFSVLRQIFSKILRELEDLESPMKTPVVSPTGQWGSGVITEDDKAPGGLEKKEKNRGEPQVAVVDPLKEGLTRQRSKPLPNWYLKTFEDEKAKLRSEFDKDQRVIYINDMHPDYLTEKKDPHSRLNYVLLITVKEYVLYNNPRATDVTISEEMIRLLVRARKHIPKHL